jgi:hypothetical protein
MRVIDTTEGIFQIYDSGDFDIDRWKKYVNNPPLVEAGACKSSY